MALINAYSTREDFLDWVTPTDTTAHYVEDTVIDAVLEAVSRYIDDQTGKHFYPVIETRKFDIPDDNTLYIDDDLLAVTTFTNGDDTTITSASYILLPPNRYPKWAIKLIGSTSVTWEADSNDDVEQVIDVLGIWGYHNDYARRAWETLTTTSEELDASETAVDLTSAAGVKTGHILKIENELMHVSSKASNTVTVTRGANGSTAATHSTAATVTVWRPIREIEQACKMIAQNVYRRFGLPSGEENIVTASGVIITPRDVPTLAAATLKRLEPLV